MSCSRKRSMGYVIPSMISAPGGRTIEMVDGLITVDTSIEFTGTVEDMAAGIVGK